MTGFTHRVLASRVWMPAFFLSVLLFSWLCACLPAHADALIKQCFLKEMFGVSHAAQVVEFDMGQQVIDPNNSYLLDYNGQEVPYQLLAGNTKIAFVADLPANADRTWSLYFGRAPNPPATNTVTVTTTAEYHEITNGLTGVRVPIAMGNPASPRAPVQGMRMRDGTWSATGPNTLSVSVPGTAVSATGLTITFLEQGPIKTIIQLDYTFNRPLETWPDGTTNPAGTAHYISTISLQAGQPSIDFVEDADIDVTYSLDLYNAIHPTKGRYRGHHADSIANGYVYQDALGNYLPEGQGNQITYPQSHTRPAMDAYVDLQYSTTKAFRRMAVWDPWIYNSGWYWQLYDHTAGTGANFAGTFAGPASLALGAPVSGVNPYTAPAAVLDLDSRTDAAGNLHTVYISGSAVWYEQFDATLTPGTPQQLAAGLSNPDVVVLNSGVVSVAGYETAGGLLKIVQRDTNGNLTTEPVVVDNPALWTLEDPYAWQSATATTHFLVLYGAYNGQRGLHLFSRDIGGAPTFTHRDYVQAYYYGSYGYAERNISRPSMAMQPDGRIQLLYTDTGGYVCRAIIEPGTVVFSTSGRYDGNVLNFGVGIDPATGDVFCGNQAGQLCYHPLGGTWSYTTLGLATDHHGQGPNRRVLASATTGEKIAMHGGKYYLYQGGVWSLFTEANNLSLANPRVHYANGHFLLLGRKDGKLTVYTWQPGGTVTLAQQIASTEQRAAGFTMTCYRRSPDTRYFAHVRFGWGFFAGVTGTDIADYRQVQPIARQMNIHSGINLNKVNSFVLEYPDPTQPYGQMYMERSIIQGMIDRVRADQGGPYGGGYYQYLYNAESSARPMIDMWGDVTGVKTHDCANSVNNFTTTLLDRYVNGDGVYDFSYHYWMGGVSMARQSDTIDQTLANEYVTTTDKAKLKASASLYANILWDDDFVPLQDGHGLNLGTENMPVQQIGYRDTYALFLSEHPTMAPRIAEVANRASSMLNGIVNEFGAEIGSAHYTGASFSPVNNIEMQLRMLGGDNPFVTEDKLAKFSEFYMNLMTPAEVRFGGKRKLVAIGDGSTEGSSLFGELATGFSTSNSTLSARLMGAFNAEGKPHNGFFGTTLLRINEDAASASPNLGNATFPGWCSVLRYGWDTNNETSVHFVNGDFYRDHRHADHGMVTMYALGAPLSIDWGSIYYPQVSGGYQHSMVIPETNIGAAWDADNSSLSAGSYGIWGGSTQDAFASFTNSGNTVAHFTKSNGTAWTRTVRTIHPNDNYPILWVKDIFAGSEATANKVFTLNLMAQGSVETPAGTITPTTRFYNHYAGQYQYPSNGTVFTVPTGLSRFRFTGQQFGTAGVTPAIDWDLYNVSDVGQQAFIGNWGHNWHPGVEQSQFLTANGRSFEETQHILRIRGGGAFNVLLLPYRKGLARADQTVTQNGATVTITGGGETTNVNENNYSFQSAAKTIVATFDSAYAAAYNLTAEGGPVEVVNTGSQITITAHGTAGQRKIGVPTGYWNVLSGSLVYDAGQGKWLMAYNGGDPAVAVLQGNQPPTVSLTNPTDGQTFNAFVNLTLAATAADSDGSIAKVEFYRGTTKIGEDTTAPYTFTWASVPAGTYTLTAKAYDDAVAFTTSDPVSITVQACQLPVPANGLQLWLMGDGNVTKDVNNAVSTWVDQSGQGHHATQTQGTAQPTWLASAICGKPALSFNSNIFFNVTGAFQVGQVYVVFKSPTSTFSMFTSALGGKSTAERTFLYQNAGTNFHSNPYPSAVWKNGVALSGSNGFDLGDITQPMRTTVNVAHPELTREYYVGRTDGYTGQLQIAEILAYQTPLSYGDRQKVEQYLRDKYALGDGLAWASELDSRQDSAGAMHTVYQRGEELWYAKFDASLVAAPQVKLTTGVRSPNLLVTSDGHIKVVGYDQASGSLFLIDRGPSGTVASETVMVDNPSVWTLEDQYGWQASAGNTHFLLLFGTYNAQRGLHLFSRDINGTGAFTHWDYLASHYYGNPINGQRNIARPIFQRQADGRIQVVYSDTGGYLCRATIESGATTFSGVGRLGTVLIFGAGLDPDSGDVFTGDQLGQFCYRPAATNIWGYTSMSLLVDHHGQGDNRRTLATAPNGDAVAIHITGNLSGGVIIRRVGGGAWERFTEANNLGLTCPRVHYQSGSNRFVLVGIKNGVVVVYTWQFGGNVTQVNTQSVATTGLQLWLMGDAGVTKDGNGLVSTWADQSGQGHDATQTLGSAQPTWQATSICGKPALSFNSNIYLNVTGAFQVGQVYVVFKSPTATFSMFTSALGGKSTAERTYLYQNAGTNFHSNPYPSAVWKNGVALSGSNGFDLGDITQPMRTTVNVAHPELTREYYVGRTDGYTGQLQIAEILAYQTPLSYGDRQKVEQYLRDKYGLGDGLSWASELDSRQDSGGAVHTVYQRGEDFWYAKYDNNLVAAPQVKLSTGVRSPNLLLVDSSHIKVVGYDQASTSLFLIDRASSGAITSETVTVDNPSLWTLEDQYGWQASSGSTHFLLLFGTYNAQRGLHLFSRDINGTGAFTHRDYLSSHYYGNPINGQRNVARPIFQQQADGRIQVVYSDTGGYLCRATIEAGATTFSGVGRLGTVLIFGAGLDPDSGDIFTGDHLGQFCYRPASTGTWGYTTMSLLVDHHGQGDNRRTLATASNGDAVAIHITGNLAGGVICRRVGGGAWERFTEANNLGLTCPRVHYQSANNRFVLVGIKNGVEVVYTWTSSGTLTRVF
ncbi:MAG: Ig-like domain-containing protein [Armatimonadota bacterium]